MDIAEAIVAGGVEAVLRYRKVAGLRQDNEIPEVFLGSVIASRIHHGLNLHAHVERPYTVIASELGIQLTAELLTGMGGLRADVAVYDVTKPVAVIELKVFDESKSAAAIVADRDKMFMLSKLRSIETYIGVLVTDVSRQACRDRVHLLSERLECSFDQVGKRHRSLNGEWEWCFAAAKVA